MKRSYLLFCAILLSCVIFPSSYALSQQRTRNPNVHFILREIVHNKYDVLGISMYPDKVEVNSKGGFVEFSIKYSENCTEKYHFEFTFDEDMSVLNVNRDYAFTSRARLISGLCDNKNDAFMQAGSNGGNSSLIHKTQYKEISQHINTTNGTERLYANGFFGYLKAKKGKQTGAFYPDYASKNFNNQYSWLNFTISAGSPLKDNSFYYEFLFIYQIIEGEAAPVGAFSCPPPDCSGFPGTVRVWNFETNTGECWCPDDKVWSPELNKCVDIKRKAN